jgi:hypothetical protein
MSGKDSNLAFKVEPNWWGGYYVVEDTPDGYRIPRGYSYPKRWAAELALPFVQAGNHWPTLGDLGVDDFEEER